MSRFLIIDGYGFIFRAYHVLPPLTARDGMHVGALYGFASMLLKLISEFNPSEAVIVLDSGSKNFRHDLYDQYKANRPPAPEDLVFQLQKIQEVTSALNFTSIAKEGFEADDIIATLAKKNSQAQKESLIISSDKDLMQLVDPYIGMYDPVKAKYITEQDIFDKFGVLPSKVREVQALMGDSSDNIPGVPGIGPKTAAKLIGEFETVDNLLNSAEQIQNIKQREKILSYKEQAILSWHLVGLDSNVSMEEEHINYQWSPPAQEEILNFINLYGFQSLKKRIVTLFKFDEALVKNHDNIAQSNNPSNSNQIDQKEKLSSEEKRRAAQKIIECSSPDMMQVLLKEIDHKGSVAIYLEPVTKEKKNKQSDNASDDPLSKSDSTQYSHKIFLTTGADIYLIFWNHRESSASMESNQNMQADLFSADNHPASRDAAQLQDMLYKILSDKSIKKISYNFKKILHLFSNIDIHSFEDLEIMYYISRLGKGLNLESLIVDVRSSSFDASNLASPDTESLSSASIKADSSLDSFNIDRANYASDLLPICYFLDAYQYLFYLLLNQNLIDIYLSIDLPVSHILHSMERKGIRIDATYLEELSQEFGKKIVDFEKMIFSIAGEEFNIASPKQLQNILFNKLQIEFPKNAKQKKTGNNIYSTNSEILYHLKASGYEIADLILQYRHFAKLKNTYTDGLKKHIDKNTHRIHTTFLQSAVSTSRLSSVNPNLQNIPIRTEEGNNIRAAFIADQGCKFIVADYSQIELRILSHIANVSSLKSAFNESRDIHNETASQIFQLPINAVDKEMRRKAKAINFGIIYGISAFGLAAQLSVPRSAASEYIKQYFIKYPEIKEYMDSTIEFARKNGFVQNLIGRKIFIPNINSKNHTIRSIAERSAINAPIQSANSDIVKYAMINLNRVFKSSAMKSEILLQIHDELVIVTPEAEIDNAARVVRDVMSNSLSLDVSLDVVLKIGDNWKQAK